MLRNFFLLPLLSLSLAAQTPVPAPATPKPAAAPSAAKPAAKPATPAKPEARKDAVLAMINGKPVLESDFLMFLDMAYNPQQRMQIGMAEGAMQQVQEQYLQTRLFEAKARKDGLDKGPAFAKKRAMLETDILVRALFERDGAKLQEKIKVSDPEIKAFYDKNPDKFKSPETFTARHILVGSKEGPAPDAKTLSDEELNAKVAKVQAALKDGKKFEDVAKEFSDDPGSKEKGGLYENISFGSFVPEFEAAVRTQKIGEVGAPVKTQSGYHLIQVEKLSPSEVQTFEASKEKAQQLATTARQEQVMKDFLDAIKKEIPYSSGFWSRKGECCEEQAGQTRRPREQLDAQILLLVTLPALMVCAGEVREEILVVVNGHVITRRVFQQAVEQEAAALYRQFSGKGLDEKLRDAREKTLQGLIDSFVLEDKSVDLGIQITDDYLSEMVEGIKKENKFKSDADFEQALRSSMGIGLNEYFKRTRQQMTQQEVLRREVFSRVAIEDQELRAYYEDHKDEYRQPSRFRIRELVLPKGITPEEQQASRTKVQEIQGALKSGTSFEELVKENSTSPTRSLGGDLGWMPKGLLVASIEEAALSLKVDQISGPIETDKDIYLIQLLASDLDAVKPFTEIKAQILEKLQEPKAQNAIQNYLNGLRVRANIRYMVPKDQILKG